MKHLIGRKATYRPVMNQPEITSIVLDTEQLQRTDGKPLYRLDGKQVFLLILENGDKVDAINCYFPSVFAVE